MATFPTGIADGLHSPITGDTIAYTDVSLLVAEILSIEAKVGIDSSAVATSHDYLLTHLPAQAGNWDAGAVEVRAQTFESDVVTGTAPFTIASTTNVTNLNADTCDGKHVDGSDGAGEITTNNGAQTLTNKTLTAPTLTTPTLGVATATTLNGLTIDTTTGTLDVTNGKTLTITGDATISATPYTPGGTDVAIADGGTGAGTAQAAINALAGGVTANKVLRGNGTNILLASVALATDVTGTLPVGNGGTGVTAASDATGGVAVVGTAWTDYSDTSTVVGWSSFTLKKIYYKKIAKTVFIQFSFEGVSNSTSVTFTVADAAATAPATQGGLLYFIQNNGLNVAATGSCRISANGTTVTCYKDPSSAASWTATNNKTAYGCLTYEAAA